MTENRETVLKRVAVRVVRLVLVRWEIGLGIREMVEERVVGLGL